MPICWQCLGSSPAHVYTEVFHVPFPHSAPPNVGLSSKNRPHGFLCTVYNHSGHHVCVVS
jgi:hypothetical protein